MIKKLIIESTTDQDLSQKYKELTNQDLFKQIFEFKSFNKLNDFMRQHYEKLGAGSSRIVYNIEDKFVFKVAKNKKGEIQNEKEHELGTEPENITGGILTKAYAISADQRILLSEYASKISESEFNQLTGITFETFGYLCHDRFVYPYKRPGMKTFEKENTQEEIEEFTDSPFWYSLEMFISNYDFTGENFMGDFTRITSWGLRKPDNELVLIDYGVDLEILRKYYS